MDGSENERPKRRKRYAGKNPRRFSEKYKEHQPDRYGGEVEKVRASGKTPAGMHVPILVDEVIEALDLKSGMVGVDGTLGYGGHAERILKGIAPGGLLLGFDVDPIELPKTCMRLRDAGYGESEFQAVKSNYAGIRKVLDRDQIDAVDFVFADLGCSSMQIDDPERGFTWKDVGPLDMRMNPERGQPVSAWLSRVSVDKLEMVLAEFSDEPKAGEISRELAGRSLATTQELVRALRELSCVSVLGEEQIDLTIRRVFQALRIAVNEELSALDCFLRMLPACLKPGARVAVLSFHSGEDRRVKKMFQLGFRDGIYARISEGIVTAGPEERRANPRSASAKLRWAQMA